MKGVWSYCDSVLSRWGWSWRMYDLVVCFDEKVWSYCYSGVGVVQ